MKVIKEFIVPTVILFAICFVAALLLGLTNDVTAPKIAENAAKAQQEAMAFVLPDAAEFDEEAAENENGIYYTAYDKDGNVIGYAVTATGKGGYDGDITLMVGITADGAVNELPDGSPAISFLEESETPSVGGKLKKKADFLVQFAGLTGSAALTKNGGTVDAVTGATKTSTGITDAVKNALLCYSKINKEVSANG